MRELTFSQLSKFLEISNKKIFYWYKNILSGFTDKDTQEELHKFDTIDKAIVDALSGEPKVVYVPIFKAENIGRHIAIDDKNIKGEGYTIISNKETKKIIFMASTTKSKILKDLLFQVPMSKWMEVETVTKDMAENYDWVAREVFVNATRIADKFHVLCLGFDAMQAVRVRYRQEILTREREEAENFEALEREKKDAAERQGEKYKMKKFRKKYKRFENGDTEKELLARGRWLLFKHQNGWIETQAERAKILFREFPEIRIAYELMCKFRNFYEYFEEEKIKGIKQAKKDLKTWYKQFENCEITEMLNFQRSVKNHEGDILNYFKTNQTNAFAESLNAKIQRFIMDSFGFRNRDFFHFRIKKMLS